MNKFVKIILAVLAVVVIAGAGFWGGTQFAYRQVAFTSASQANSTLPRWDGMGRGNGYMNPDDVSPRNFSRDNNYHSENFGPGMMGRESTSFGMMDHSFTRFPGLGLLGGGMLLLGLIFPLGILTLIVLGIIALFRVVRRPAANQ